jgi:hypothetical protein
VTVAYFLETNVFCLRINLESPKSFKDSFFQFQKASET